MWMFGLGLVGICNVDTSSLNLASRALIVCCCCFTMLMNSSIRICIAEQSLHVTSTSLLFSHEADFLKTLSVASAMISLEVLDDDPMSFPLCRDLRSFLFGPSATGAVHDG